MKVLRLLGIALGTLLILAITSIPWIQAQPEAMLLTDGDAAGLSIQSSPYSFQETSDRLTQALESRGIRIFTTINHSENAETVGLELPNTTVFLFGNPVLGTPLMQCQQTIAIDLPQKILVLETEEGVQLAYNTPNYLSERHQLNDCAQQEITRISGALLSITNEVVMP